MIIFRCNHCHVSTRLEKRMDIAKCPKCREMHMYQYYENNSQDVSNGNIGKLGDKRAKIGINELAGKHHQSSREPGLGYPDTTHRTEKMKGGNMENENKEKKKFGESKYGKDVKDKAIKLAKAGKSLAEIVKELNGPGAKAVQRYLTSSNVSIREKE